MSLRVPALLPRVVGIVLVALGTTATLTYAAGQGIGTTGAPTAAAPAVQATVVVPDVRNQAFVFAKGSLEDAGFSWKIAGSVHGFAANTVLSQSPEPGTKLLDTGAPLITLTLKRNGPYQQVGAPQDASPYTATPDQRADLADRVLPARQPAAAPKQAAAAKPKQAAAAKPKQAAAAPRKAAAAPAARPADFVVPGGRPEPTDEIPLTLRATKLSTWLQAHRKETNANVKYWLYQHEWIVAGARLGWWHGAEALRTLIAVDQHAQSQWGIGAKSEAAARAALGFVEARAKS